MTDTPTKRPPSIPDDHVPRVPRVLGVTLPKPPVATVSAPAAPVPATPSSTPAGGAKLQTPWGSFSAPGPVFLLALLIVGVLVAVVYFVRGETSALAAKIDGLATLMTAIAKQSDEARAEVRETRRDLEAVKQYQREKAAWDAALEASRGTRIRQPEGAAPLPDLKVEQPLHAKPMPQVQVRTPPPAPP